MCKKKDSCCEPNGCKLKRSAQCSDMNTPDCCKNCVVSNILITQSDPHRMRFKHHSHENVIVSFHIISSLKVERCIQSGTLQITLFGSKKLNDKNSDTIRGMIPNHSVPFLYEPMMNCRTGPKNGMIRLFP